ATCTTCTSGCRHDAHRRKARGAHAARRTRARSVRLDDGGSGHHRQVRGRHRRPSVDPRGRRARQKRNAGGKTIAHGYLTRALVPRMAQTLLKVTGRKRGLNYGSNKVRFTNAVPAGARIRLRSFKLKSVEPMDGNGVRVTSEASVEVEGQERPALVAEISSIQSG